MAAAAVTSARARVPPTATTKERTMAEHPNPPQPDEPNPPAPPHPDPPAPTA